jgi:hypothetical protein
MDLNQPGLPFQYLPCHFGAFVECRAERVETAALRCGLMQTPAPTYEMAAQPIRETDVTARRRFRFTGPTRPAMIEA